ncbi:MAG: putative protein kinase,serine/threonine-protein kinase [Streblomastix strix]|uniref:non-specific serine/threonine protein kinase n=1 Tax=Streblomastix strix TaxID=222440 RepID=A0A5J4VCD7_9EUKA|nr:MAG: putative protein kinase,serine/threonine-protein kinase [Streblomastix strix]
MKRVDYLDDNDKQIADEEIAQMKRLTSRYTVRLVYTFQDRVDMYMVMEYCEKGDLRKVITELQQLPEEERVMRVWVLFAQIILSLNFMHNKNVIHRDIKPENIFIMNDGSIRLGDFGLSKVISSKDYASIAGTRMFFSSDVYAVGICIFELLTGKHPFRVDKDEQATINNILLGKSAQLPGWIPSDLKQLICKMMNPVCYII